jgi:ABC-type transport system involved in cytochrome bd biosynthesis fused ATPase/permease subunit
MKDDFDEIRAERERPGRYRQEPEKFSGLWKQIALGIVVGYSVLGILSAVGWVITAHVIMGNLTFALPQ